MKITLDIDIEKIERDTGRRFEDKEDLYYYIDRLISYLSTHNKNYTNTQYIKIEELKDIFQAAYIEDFIIPF